MYDHKQDNFGNKLITQMRYSLSLLVGQWIKSHDYPSPDEPPPKRHNRNKPTNTAFFSYQFIPVAL